jgi:hypothetical protein
MRLYFLFFIFTISYGFSQSRITSKEIIRFNEGIAQKIIEGEHKFDTSFYLSRDEIRSFIHLVPNSMDADSVLNSELENYDLKLKRFKDFYSKNFEAWGYEIIGSDSVDWDNFSIDSSAYSFEIADAKDRNEKVNWPESKDLKLSNNALYACRGIVYISEGEKRYIMSIDTIVCEGKLKFYHTLRVPRIVRIR